MPYQVFWNQCNIFDAEGNATVYARGEFVPDGVDQVQVSNLATIGAISFVDVSLSPRAELAAAVAVAPLATDGDLPDVDEDEQPVDVVVGTVGPGEIILEGPAEGESTEATKPNKSDSKAEWVDYAVSQGADRADAESTNKDDLIALYGG